jgi:hypothetical protein
VEGWNRTNSLNLLVDSNNSVVSKTRSTNELPPHI